jgi:hypothetical protein
MALPINYDPTQTTEFLPPDSTFCWLDTPIQIINTGILVGTQPFVDVDISALLPFFPMLVYLRCTVTFANVAGGDNAWLGIDRPPNVLYPNRVQWRPNFIGNMILSHNCMQATDALGFIRYVITQAVAEQMAVNVWLVGYLRLRERP